MRTFILVCAFVCLVSAQSRTATAAKPAAAAKTAPKTATPAKTTTVKSSSATCNYVSSSTVVGAALSQVSPRPVNCGGIACAFYQTPASCLGASGPLGGLGPLGALGPLGKNAWNPTVYMSAIGDWTAWAKQINAKTSAPLSSAGPLNPTAYGKTLPSINDFGKQLQAQGIWTVLGPLGPTGALGPLGPLGPMGVHGFGRDKDGNYVTGGKIQRTITFPWDSKTKKTWELYEMYNSYDAANRVTNQDTSFMVLANLPVGVGYIQTPHSYSFTSNSDQYVTVLVTPENILDSFSLTVRSGGAVIKADATLYPNWVQFKAKKGQKYSVSIALQLSSRVSPFGFTYRLYVTGSSDMFQTSDITGPHIRTFAC